MIKIFSDPSCNFPSEKLRELKVDIFPYYINFKGENILVKTDYDDFTAEELLQYISTYSDVKFSRPPTQEWMKLIEPYLREGYDILYVSMSQKSTGSGTTLSLLAHVFKEKYSSKIELYDTKCFSWGQALLLERACQLRDEGKTISEIKEKLDKIRPYIENWYLPVNAKIWEKSNRGDSKNLLESSSFNLITCDINGVFRPERHFPSRKEGIDLLNLSSAKKVWVSFTLDVPQEEKDYILEKLPVNNKVFHCSPPFTTESLGPNSIEIGLIR